MPNWCSNTMTVVGAGAEKVNNAIRDAAALFDLVAPLPAALTELQLGFTTIDGVRYEVWRDTPDGEVPLSTAELAELERTYGTASWHDCSVANWGTKWNVDRERLRFDDGTWIFDTAWSPPLGFYEKLSAVFNVELRVAWFEPGMQFAGGATISAGTVTQYEEHLPMLWDEDTGDWDSMTSAWLEEHKLD